MLCLNFKLILSDFSKRISVTGKYNMVGLHVRTIFSKMFDFSIIDGFSINIVVAPTPKGEKSAYVCPLIQAASEAVITQ